MDEKKKKRRERRMQTAVEILSGLDDASADVLGPRPDFDDACKQAFESSSDDAKQRSVENTSQVSSHMFQPRWKRLVRAASRVLASKLEQSESTTLDKLHEELREKFTDRDAMGGGTADDIARSLGHWLEILGLHDKDTGFILLSVCALLRAPDLPWSSATWRPMLLTSIFTAIDKVCETAEDRPRAKERLHRDVVHWWTKTRADAACEAFTSREQFKDSDMSRSALARIYFELRDQGLRLSPENSSNASAVHEHSAMFSPKSSYRSHATKEATVAQALRSISSSGCSFDLSDTTSFSFSREMLPERKPENPKKLMSL